MTASIAPAQQSLAELHAQIGQFYADHFYLLDSGRADEWAQTFTEDGEFWPPNRPEPLKGREVLTAGVRKAHSCVCHDRFVWDEGQWRVQSRKVTRDDLR